MKKNALILPCSSCGVKNRVPVQRLHDGPKCGSCGAFLSVEIWGRPVDVSDADFQQEVMEADLPVLVDCWAPWCGPCRVVAPVLDLVAEQYRGRVKVVKLNMDENPVTGGRLSISSIPTLLFVKGGDVVDTLMGVQSKEQIDKVLERIL